MKGKVQVAFIIVCSIIICFIGYTSSEAVAPREKLTRLIEATEASGATVESWSWLAKEEHSFITTKEQLDALLQDLSARGLAGEWSMEKTAEGYKATAIKSYPHYKERLVVTWAKVNTKDKTFVVYEAKGTKWDDAITEKMEKIFRHNPATFTCVQAVFGDKIEGVLQNKASEILEQLSAKPIESIEELAFVSVSAYTGEWKDALAVNREKMNVQVALRSTENKTTVMVGTPIITSEY